jgi:hypothetical protein
MTQVEVLDAARDRINGYKVDVSRGERVGRVSSEWFSRPADERYLSLSDLLAAVRGRTERSRTRTVETAAIRVDASRDDAERLTLMLPGAETAIAPTHWSFGQLASLVGAPATYLRHDDLDNAGIRREPTLPEHEAIAPEFLQSADPFATLVDEPDDEPVQANMLRHAMRIVARQAALDPGDGLDI